MSTPTDQPPPPDEGNAGGTYGQGDFSPAARRSQFHRKRAGEPSVPGSENEPRTPPKPAS